MDAINVSFTSRRLSVRRYSGIVVNALQGLFRRLPKSSAERRQSDGQAERAAWLENERHQAQSIAQVQSVRLFR